MSHDSWLTALGSELQVLTEAAFRAGASTAPLHMLRVTSASISPRPQLAQCVCLLPSLELCHKIPSFSIAFSLGGTSLGKTMGQRKKNPLSPVPWANPGSPSSVQCLLCPQPQTDGGVTADSLGTTGPNTLWRDAKGGLCLWEGRSCELPEEDQRQPHPLGKQRAAHTLKEKNEINMAIVPGPTRKVTHKHDHTQETLAGAQTVPCFLSFCFWITH